jgi:anti-sigma factor RsiW
MNCPDCLALLEAYLDGEIDARGSLELEAHLGSCGTCAARLASARSLSQTLRTRASRPVPRAAFEQALRASVAGAGRGAGARRGLRRAALVVSACAASLLLGWLWGSGGTSGAAGAGLEGELVAAHVRSLEVDHLLDVASSDRHAVTPWFQGKLPFAVQSRDLAEQGFVLAGGRLDLVDGRDVAALVYRHGPHAINVFVWPAAEPDREPVVEHLRGYRLVHWTRAALQCWIVSDADEKALLELGRLLE